VSQASEEKGGRKEEKKKMQFRSPKERRVDSISIAEMNPNEDHYCLALIG